MNRPKPFQHHADAVHSGAFTGNLERASLLPGEIAARPPISQVTRADADAAAQSAPAGADLYLRQLTEQRWRQQGCSNSAPGRERPWWHWPTIAAAVVLAAWWILLAISGGGLAAPAH